MDIAQKLSGTFSLYEHVSYFLVGSCSLILGDWAIKTVPSISVDVFQPYTWPLIAYVAGHLVQGVSNVYSKVGLHRETKRDFSEKEKVILKKAAKAYNADEKDL